MVNRLSMSHAKYGWGLNSGAHLPHKALWSWPLPLPSPPQPCACNPVTSGGVSSMRKITPSDENTKRSELNQTFSLRNSALKYLPKKAPLTAQGAENSWTDSPGTWPCNIAKIFSKTSDPTCTYSEGWKEMKESYRYIDMYEKWWIRQATVKPEQLTFRDQPPLFLKFPLEDKVQSQQSLP